MAAAGEHDLIVPRASVISRVTECTLKSQFGPEKNRRSHPVVPRNAILYVLRLKTGALSLDVVEVLVAETDEVVFAELPVDVVQN